MESLQSAAAFAPAPRAMSMSMRTGPADCRNRKAMSWNCSRNCPTSGNPPRACRARWILPKRYPGSRSPSPQTPNPGSLFLGLPAHGLLCRGNGLLVAEEPAPQRLQLLVQFVEDGNTGGDVEVDDVALGHHVEHFDEGAQRISMRDDEHVLAGAKFGDDSRFPIGQHAR